MNEVDTVAALDFVKEVRQPEHGVKRGRATRARPCWRSSTTSPHRAPLAFWGVAASAEMVQGINALRNARARIIVDDVGLLGEPKFQDGMIAQTVRSFAQAGGVYVGAAGNQTKQHYRATYTRAGGAPPGWAGLHNYLAGGVYVGNSIVLPSGCPLLVFLKWNDPWGAARDDFDLFIARASDGPIVARSIKSRTAPRIRSKRRAW